MDIQSLLEAKQVGSAMLVTGALNPYTSAHEAVAEMAMQHAMNSGHTHFYHGIGASEMKPDAPLTHQQKSKIVSYSHKHLKKKLGSELKTEVIPKQNSVSPFHQIAYLINKGHKHITVAVGSDQLAEGGLRSHIEKHMRQHGGFLGMDNKPHQVQIDFHQLGKPRHEGEISRDDILREISAGNIQSVKAGRLRSAVTNGDFELASAMMPESVKNKKAYFKLIADQQKKVEKAKKSKKKKKITEHFSIEKLKEFSELLNESSVVSNVVKQRTFALKTELGKAKAKTFGMPKAVSDAAKANARLHVRAIFDPRIRSAKITAVRAGLDVSPRRKGTPQGPKRGTMHEEILNEAKKVARGSDSIAKVRADSKMATTHHKKDANRKKEQRRQEGRVPKFAVVVAKEGKKNKIKIVTKQDIGKSKVLLAPEKFNKNEAKRYLDDPSFEITDSSKKLFPGFTRKKAGGKPKGKKQEQKQAKSGKKAKAQKSQEKQKPAAPKVTSKDPREILPPLPRTPPRGQKVTSGKSQFPDWDHKATELEEALPVVLNQLMGVKTGSESEKAIARLQSSQTLYAAAERAANLVVQNIGECVAFHMGKAKGKISKMWEAAGAKNNTSKSDIVFIPVDEWKKAGGKIEKVNVNKCVRASVKCGSARILNAESGEATATIEAAMMYAGDIAAKNPKVKKLVGELKDLVKKFAKNAELGQWDTSEIKKLVQAEEEPKDKQFKAAKMLVEQQEALHEKAGAKLIEIFNESEEFKIGFTLEGMTGRMKFGEKEISCASHVLALNKDGTDVKLDVISEKLVKKMMGDLNYRGGFKGRSKEGGTIRTLSTLLNIDLREDFEPAPQPTASAAPAGYSSQVENDLKEIGDNVYSLMNYIGIEPTFITTNEVDMTDYIDSPARDYNLISIDGAPPIAIPVKDYGQFEQSGTEEMNLSTMTESYEIINDLLIESMKDENKFHFILTSGLVSPETIMNSRNGVEVTDILHEMWENSLLNPELFEVFLNEAKRNYKKEYREYHSKPEQRANRSKRVLARRKMIKKGRVHKGDGKDVDHENGNPQDNSDGNLRVRSVHANRGDKSHMREEYGAGEMGTDELLNNLVDQTPLAVNPVKKVVKGIKYGIKRK